MILSTKREHAIKCWTPYFEAIFWKRKMFEIRKDDREYNVGDTLRIEEYEPETKTYTGRVCWREITYIMRGAEAFGLVSGFCILSLDWED